MPIYEFRCPNCETSIRIKYETEKRDTPTYCPDCKTLMKRSFQIGGISFAGTGWGKD